MKLELDQKLFNHLKLALSEQHKDAIKHTQSPDLISRFEKFIKELTGNRAYYDIKPIERDFLLKVVVMEINLAHTRFKKPENAREYLVNLTYLKEILSMR